MANTYLTVHDYLRAITGQETSSLLGNLMRLSGAVIVGATSLPVTPNTTVNLSVNDPITIFDGASSEVVTVTSATAAGASSIPVTATQYAHASATSLCSDGTQGSLAQAIIDGSANVERICNQALLQATYTDTLPLMTTRAMIDNNQQLIVRPRQFPATAVSSASIEYSASNSMTIDASQAIIESPQRLVKFPVVKSVGSGNNYMLFQYLAPNTAGSVVLSYTAGFVYSALPAAIRRAAAWLTSDILSDRSNPTGAADFTEGKVSRAAFLRGDLTGESVLYKRARKELSPYTQESW